MSCGRSVRLPVAYQVTRLVGSAEENGLVSCEHSVSDARQFPKIGKPRIRLKTGREVVQPEIQQYRLQCSVFGI